MRKVRSLSEFPKDSYIAQFRGKSYVEAVDSADKSGLPVTHYFEQLHKYKDETILVSYKKENENECTQIYN